MEKCRESIYKDAAKLGLKTVSYSQFSLFYNCPISWYKSYVDKIKIDSPSIDLLFGSAFHSTLQDYLVVHFNDSSIKADAMDLNKMLHDNMISQFKEITKNGTVNGNFTTRDTMSDYFTDGCAILDFIRQYKREYFDKVKYELVGCEYPLLVPSDTNPKVGVICFIDIVLKERGKNNYVLYDIKTSYQGWRDNKKKEFTTKSQLVLYKKFFAKSLSIPKENIEIKFLIVKRKLWETEFKQKRVQLFEPASGKPTLKNFDEEFNKFISIFDQNGKVKNNIVFSKAIDKKKCKYCNFKGTDHCVKQIKHQVKD